MPLHHTAETLRAFNDAVARCINYTKTNQCTAYVNARVHRVMDMSGRTIDFTLTFSVDDWYNADSTVARCDNGQVKSNF
jgi:hypothetical protein